MTIREQFVKSDAYYGWGGATDFDMERRWGGKTIIEIGKGDYNNPALAPAQIEQIRQVAKSHDNKFGGSHNIGIHIYEK